MLRGKMMDQLSQKNRDKNLCDEKYGSLRKLEPIELSMQKLMRKIFELQLIESLAHRTALKLELKKKQVADEKRKLDELQYRNWERKNAFCSRIWKFTEDNDLYAIYNKYLDMPKQTRCKFTLDVEHDAEILKLRSEVDELNKKFDNKNTLLESLEEKIEDAKIELETVESYRDKDPQIIRLKLDIDKYQYEVSKLLETKIQMISNEKLNNPSEDRKNEFVKASELIAKTERRKDTVRRPTFTVKRESAISRKFADMRNAVRRSIDKKPVSIKEEEEEEEEEDSYLQTRTK